MDTAITSTSRDPSRFTLPSHYLAVDSTYTVTVTAKTNTSYSSASVTVYVYHGTVTTTVIGGYERSVPVNEDLTLDASSSRGDDVPSLRNQSTLTYKVCSSLIRHALSCSAVLCLAIPCLALLHLYHYCYNLLTALRLLLITTSSYLLLLTFTTSFLYSPASGHAVSHQSTTSEKIAI